MSPAKPGAEKMSAALDAVQRIALQMETDESVSTVTENQERRFCQACGNLNQRENRFCAKCGVPLQEAPEGEAPAPDVKLMNPLAPAVGQHHYHHHYHHHYFATGDGAGSAAAAEPRTANAAPVAREAARAKTAGGTGFSRAEAAVRKLAQDWAQACNTKHLDDIVDLYTADAMVMRPNVPPVRGTAAVREYFFSVLEAGLGEVEMDAVRVEVFGDFAYEVGRCTMLVPGVAGKRREERGKYVILATRQAGEWKIAVDSWASDLSLAIGEVGAVKTQSAAVRGQGKG